jgi:hypothetical protein
MSNWKNPNSPQEHPSGSLWNSPKVDLSQESNSPITLELVVKAVFGFVLIVSLNALALFLFLNLVGQEVTYRNAVIAGVVYVCWRVYDIVVFSKVKKR